MISKLSILIIFLVISQLTIYATEKDSTISYRKNTIRWNMTPMAVVGPKSIVLGYERVIKPYQTISINIGYLEMSPFTNELGEEIHFLDDNKTGGFDFSADYRFYFKNRNKNLAPDGVYWGPYMAYYGIWQEGSVNILKNSIVKNTASIQSKLQMYSLGLQLGYQFVIKDRFTIDLILLGPSYTYYDISADVSFDTEINIQDPVYQEIYEKIKNTNPLIAEILKEQNFDTKGRIGLSYYGFRYGINLGWRF